MTTTRLLGYIICTWLPIGLRPWYISPTFIFYVVFICCLLNLTFIICLELCHNVWLVPYKASTMFILPTHMVFKRKIVHTFLVYCIFPVVCTAAMLDFNNLTWNDRSNSDNLIFSFIYQHNLWIDVPWYTVLKQWWG